MKQNVASVEVPVIRMEGVAVGALQDLSTIVVEQIDWTGNVGDFWVVAGLQGSGKSDLLMLTGSLMAPQQGRYRLFGEEMPIFDETRLPVRLQVGIVFDGGQLFNHLTVRENVALAFRYHHNLTAVQAASEVQRMLEVMELTPWADSTPGALGRNWQKRVGLARALMLRPELLLVDNPLVGLDPLHALWWLNTLTQLVQGHPRIDLRPMTLVVTTADLRPWKDRATHFAILRNKRFLVVGQRDQLETASQELIQDLLPTP